METTDKSTPSNTEVTDTSSDVSLCDTSASEPQKEALEPEKALDEADVTDEPAEDNELIFGKFKTMEEARKGYKEAERAITKAADLEKQLEQYKYLSENFEKDGIARRQGYADRLDMALTSDVRKHELDNYALAAGYTLSPQEQLKVSELISRCRNGCGEADLPICAAFFHRKWWLWLPKTRHCIKTPAKENTMLFARKKKISVTIAKSASFGTVTRNG